MDRQRISEDCLETRKKSKVVSLATRGERRS